MALDPFSNSGEEDNEFSIIILNDCSLLTFSGGLINIQNMETYGLNCITRFDLAMWWDILCCIIKLIGFTFLTVWHRWTLLNYFSLLFSKVAVGGHTKEKRYWIRPLDLQIAFFKISKNVIKFSMANTTL